MSPVAALVVSLLIVIPSAFAAQVIVGRRLFEARSYAIWPILLVWVVALVAQRALLYGLAA